MKPRLQHIDVSMAPMEERTQVGSEGNTYLGGNAFMYAKGGRIRNFSKDDAYRFAPNNSIESEILDRVRGQINALEFAGNMYIKGFKNDIFLYELDDFDENFLKDVGAKVKPDERVYRYVTRTTAIGGMVPLIKINPSRQLVYFNESEDEDVKWSSRGQEFDYLNLVGEKNKFKKGGMLDYSRKMIESQNKEVSHHSDELKSILDKYKKMSVEPWVIAKMERATTDLSDVTHYLDGKEGKDYYAKGGKIKDQYEGRTPEDIWNNLSLSQKQHFIYDHVEEISEYKGIENLPTNEIRKAYKSDWDNLDNDIKNRFSKHTREGQYATGGRIEGDSLEKVMEDAKKISKQRKGNFYVLQTEYKNYTNGTNYIQFTWGEQEDVDYIKGITRPMGSSISIKILMRYNNGQLMSSENEVIYINPEFKGTYAKGGGIPTKIVNKGKTYNRNTYKAIYGDFDKDGLMNSDDPNPVKKGDKNRVEQLSFPKIFDSLLDTKGKLDSTMYDAVDKLKKITPDGGKIYARTKTPYSIINKLIDSRMIVPKDPKKGLTDMVGTTIVVDNTDQVFEIQKEIEKGVLGEILPEGVDKNGKVILADNKYLNPKGGYRAIHYIVIMDDIPVEVQLKTKRMKEINELAHPHYKAKNLNSDFMEYLTTLADKGDRGDKKAQAEFNRIMRNKKDVSEKLKMDRTYMYAHGGRVQEIYGDEMELDGIFEDFKD